MILIFTDKNDVHADAVISQLDQLGASYLRFNQDVESLLLTTITFDLEQWSIKSQDSSFNSSQVSCVWLRRSYVQTLLEQNVDASAGFKLWKSEWNKTLQGLYSSLEAVPWFTPFREVFKAENKYLQLKLAVDCGFQTPPTLVSNDKAKLLAFAALHRRVAFKLMHQDVYRMPDGVYKGLYTNVLTPDDLAAFGGPEENTVVLQKYIDKQYEVRYTVVGDDHFVARIDSQASEISQQDWRRYDLKTTPYTELTPPDAVREKVRHFVRRLGLHYGALDFIVNEEGAWVFLEINSLGQYLWVEDLTGMPISESIARWLHTHSISQPQ